MPSSRRAAEEAAEVAYELIRDIGTGRYEPGQVLMASKLAEPYDTTPEVVRRALALLVKRGLVIRAPGTKRWVVNGVGVLPRLGAPQAYAEVKARILDGRYPPGRALPSTVAAAKMHRTTPRNIQRAYGMLEREKLVHRPVSTRPPVPVGKGGKLPKPPLAPERTADAIERAIRAGLYPDGTNLPSQAELAKRHGISPSTAYGAIKTLASRGLIKRRGRGQRALVLGQPDPTRASA